MERIMLQRLLFILGIMQRVSSIYLQGPVFTLEPPSNEDLIENSKGHILNCLGHGSPTPQITWLDKNLDPVIPIAGLREPLSNGSLYFPSFSIMDYKNDVHGSIYVCSLSNIVGRILSRECKIRSDNTIPLKLQVTSSFVSVGNTALVKCVASKPVANDLLKINWIREDGEKSIIQVNTKFAITSKGELHVKHVNNHDGLSKFYCQAVNRLTGDSIISDAGHLVITGANEDAAPKIEHSSPEEITAKSSEEVDIICVAQSSPPPTYRWYRQVGNMLQEIHSMSVLLRVLDTILRLPSVQPSDSSDYICVASNSLGEDRKKFTLHVISEFTVFIRPQKQVIDSGSSGMFNCSVHGGSTRYTISWLKDGLPVSIGGKIEIHNQGETLIIRNVNRNDKGMYQCYVRSKDETAQGTAELILGAVAPQLEYTFSEQTLQPGHSISLKCVASGNPHPRILWHLDGGLVYPQGDYILGSFMDDTGVVVSHLNISSSRVHHGGLYSCVARNILGSTEHSSLINIYGAPSSRQMLNLTVVSGIDVHLRCPAYGYPIVSTIWQYNDLLVVTDSRHQLLDNGTLLISDVTGSKDKGEYLCTVRNQQGQTAKGKLYLTVMAPPKVQPFQFDEDIQEGDRTQVSCTIKSGDLPMEFTWRKDGGSMSHDSDVQIQNYQFVSNLLFSKLSARHSGYYTCIVSNAVAIANHTALLRIKVSPVWTSEPMDTSVLYNQMAVLNCQADGFPTPSISWTKGLGKDRDSFSTLDGSRDIIIASNGSLIITSTERHHEGYYKCEAKNSIGNPLVKTVYLKVNVPAYFKTKYLNQSGVAGDKIILTCEAEGDSPLKVTWSSPPPAPVHTVNTPTGATTELHLNHLSRSYAGMYHCTATNSFGYDHMSIQLHVKELPEPPQNIELVKCESRSISIRWTQVPGSITHYVVTYKEEESQKWYNLTILNDFTARITSLTPATKYIIRVHSFNELGTSESSLPLVAQTMEEAPSGPPQRVEVTARLNTILVHWKSPKDKEANGKILGYEVWFREMESGSSGMVRKVLGEHKNSLTLTNLKHHRTYEITVKAYNQIGPGPPSPPVHQITEESVPSQPPERVRCMALSPEKLHVQWDPPPLDHHNGIILGYKVFYKRTHPGADVNWINNVKRTTSLSANIYSLEKYTNYSVRVMAYTAAGDGVKSQIVYCVTAEDVPGAPAQVKAMAMTSESILVAWRPPITPNGQIIKYYVYMEHPNKKISNETVYGEQNIRHTFRSLDEGKIYIFWVSASTNAGEGPSTNKITQITTTRVPARIASFSNTVPVQIGTRVSLECITVGLPTPNRHWVFPDDSHQFVNRKNTEAILWLGPVTERDAGNYTCEAENVFGKDQVTYGVIVLQLPPAPLVSISSTTTSSISFYWTPQGDGGSPIIGYVACYQTADTVNWLRTELDTEELSYTYKNLKCGTKHHIFVQTINAVGFSKPSKMISVSTKGNAPGIPKQEDIIRINSTYVVLFLEKWPDNECPIVYFNVQYNINKEWISIEPEQLQPETLIVTDLLPAKRYTFKVTAVNEAGVAKYDYTFSTLTSDGGVVPKEYAEEPNVPLVQKLNTIIPIVSSILCILAISACLYVLLQKRKLYDGYESGHATTNSVSQDFDNDHIHQAYVPSPVMKPSPIRSRTNQRNDDYDICPYATFSLPQSSRDMQTFNQQQPPSDLIREPHHSMLRRAKTPINLRNHPDAVGLDISCISNQPTLPMRKEKIQSDIKTTTFIYDGDVARINNYKSRQYSPQIGSRRDIDSSTESVNDSPILRRKVKGHNHNNMQR